MGEAARKLPEASPQKRRVIMVTANKGGTGKTTIAINLATAAAVNGYRVEALDLDTQHNLEHWAMRRKRIPSMSQITVHAGQLDRVKVLLPYTEAADIVIIDTPPRFAGDDTRNLTDLIALSDFILVPTQTSQLDLEVTIPWIKALETEKGKQIAGKVAFIINRVNLRSTEIRDAKSLLIRHGRVCPTEIRDLIHIQRGMKSGHAMADTLEATQGRQDFLDLWAWIEKEIGL